MANTKISFTVDKEEWKSFWSYVSDNTGQHGMGPVATFIRDDKDQKKKDERAMLFFLMYKDTILYKPQVCSCGCKTKQHGHDKSCVIEKFNRIALEFNP